MAAREELAWVARRIRVGSEQDSRRSRSGPARQWRLLGASLGRARAEDDENRPGDESWGGGGSRSWRWRPRRGRSRVRVRGGGSQGEGEEGEEEGKGKRKAAEGEEGERADGGAYLAAPPRRSPARATNRGARARATIGELV